MNDSLEERHLLQMKADGKIPQRAEGNTVFYSGNAGYMELKAGVLVDAIWKLGEYTVRMSDGEYAIDDGYGVLCSPGHVCADMPKARATMEDVLDALETLPWEDNDVHFISRRYLVLYICSHVPKKQRKRILSVMAPFRQSIQ